MRMNGDVSEKARAEEDSASALATKERRMAS